MEPVRRTLCGTSVGPDDAWWTGAAHRPAGRSARQLPGAKDNMIDSRPSSARQASEDGTAAGIPCFPRYWRQRKSIWDAGVVAGRRHRSYSRITLEVAPVPLACDRKLYPPTTNKVHYRNPLGRLFRTINFQCVVR